MPKKPASKIGQKRPSGTGRTQASTRQVAEKFKTQLFGFEIRIRGYIEGVGNEQWPQICFELAELFVRLIKASKFPNFADRGRQLKWLQRPQHIPVTMPLSTAQMGSGGLPAAQRGRMVVGPDEYMIADLVFKHFIAKLLETERHTLPSVVEAWQVEIVKNQFPHDFLQQGRCLLWVCSRLLSRLGGVEQNAADDWITVTMAASLHDIDKGWGGARKPPTRGRVIGPH